MVGFKFGLVVIWNLCWLHFVVGPFWFLVEVKFINVIKKRWICLDCWILWFCWKSLFYVAFKQSMIFWIRQIILKFCQVHKKIAQYGKSIIWKIWQFRADFGAYLASSLMLFSHRPTYWLYHEYTYLPTYWRSPCKSIWNSIRPGRFLFPVCPRYDHSMYFSTTSMYPFGLSVDVNRPDVIMTQTDVAQLFLMTPHQLLQHIVHADVALNSSLVYRTDTKTTPRQRASHLDGILSIVWRTTWKSPWCRVRVKSMLGALKRLALINVGDAVSLLFDSKETAWRPIRPDD